MYRFTHTPGSGTHLVQSLFPTLARPNERVIVHCGGCDRELTVTHLGWHIDFSVPCDACGAGADLVHARRHADCALCEE